MSLEYPFQLREVDSFSRSASVPASHITGLTIKDNDRLTRTLYDGVNDDSNVANIDLTSAPQYRGKVRQAYTIGIS